MHIFSFSFVHFWSSRPLGVWGTHKKLERTTHTLYIRLYSTVRRGGSCVGKVLAKGRATSETQQGEIDRSVHTSLYHPARLPLCPAHFGVATNYIVSPKKRRSSVVGSVVLRLVLELCDVEIPSRVVFTQSVSGYSISGGTRRLWITFIDC